MKLIFYDLETTGTNCELHGIHQISGMIEIGGEVKESFNFKVQPHKGALINAEALRVGNVTLEEIRAYEPIGTVYSKFVNMLGGYCDKYHRQDKFFLVGYNNASFDNQFLRKWFEVNGDKYFGSWFFSNSIDVMVLASQHLLETRHTMENFKLHSVARACGIDIDETKLHEASYDISLTKQIYDLITCKRSVAI